MPITFPKNKSPFDWSPSFYQKIRLQGYNHERLDYSQVLLYLGSRVGISYNFKVLITTKSKLETLGTVFYDSFNPQVADKFFSNQPSSLFKKLPDLYLAYNKLPETGYPINEVDDFRLKVICNVVLGAISLGSTRSAIKLDLIQIGTQFRLDFYVPYSRVDVDQPDQDYAMIVGTSHVWSAAYLIRNSNILLTESNKKVIRKIYSFLFKDAKDDRDKLDQVYFWAPKFIIDERSEKDLFNDLGSLLAGSVDEIGTNEEVAVLNILSSMTSPARLGANVAAGNIKAGDILRKLVGTKIKVPLASETITNVVATAINNESSLFALLYNKMNDYGGDNNFTALINQLFALWLLSDYATLSSYEIKYKSKKSFGFYFTNYNFFLSDDSTQIEVKAAEYTEEYLIEDITKKQTSLNTFAPVSLTSGTEVEVAEQDAVGDFMPAFYLKAIDDKNAVANLETGIFLAVDIITTFTGFGNLLKFKNLYKVLNLTEKGLTATKALTAAKIVISGIELTSGVVGAMITLSNDCDSKFCNALRSCLFYLDLMSLGADVVVSKLLKKSAQKALELKAFTPNKGVDQAQYDEMVRTLEGLAGVKVAQSFDNTEFFRQLNSLFDDSGGRLLRKKELFLLRDSLWAKYKVRVRFVDTDYKLINQKNILYEGKKISKLEYWNIRGTLGSFTEGPPPEMFLRLGSNKTLNSGLEGTSELTIFHEMVHLKYWAEGRPKLSLWQEEVVVFDEIMKVKNRWTDSEILDSYYYVISGLKDSKLENDLNGFIAKYESEIEKIQSKIFEQ